MAFESTNAILGIGEAERAKKNDRWKKLMELAGLGTDIWGTLSGRKYATGERVAGQEYASGENVLDREHDVTMAGMGQEYAKEQFDWRATFDAEEAAKDRAWREGQSTLDRDLEKQLSAAQISAQMGDRSERRMNFLAEWTQRAYELAVSNPSFLGPEGTFDPSKREALRKFLYTQVDGLPNLSNEEIAWAKNSFDGFVNGLGAAASAPKPDAAKVTPELPATELLASAKDTIAALAQIALPPEVKKEVSKLETWLPSLGAPGGRGPSGVTVRDILSKLTTIYNTYKYSNKGRGAGQAQDDIRVTK